MVQITPIFLDLSGCNVIFSSFFFPWLLMPKLFESLWAPYFPDCISHCPFSSTLNAPFKIFLLESTKSLLVLVKASHLVNQWFALLLTLRTITRIRTRAVFRVLNGQCHQLRKKMEFSLDPPAESLR